MSHEDTHASLHTQANTGVQAQTHERKTETQSVTLLNEEKWEIGAYILLTMLVLCWSCTQNVFRDGCACFVFVKLKQTHKITHIHMLTYCITYTNTKNTPPPPYMPVFTEPGILHIAVLHR